jgi:hypothetical protein
VVRKKNEIDKTECPFQTSNVSIHHCRKTDLEERNLRHTKEELKDCYSVTLKLPLRPLCGVKVTRRKMQLLDNAYRFLCGAAVVRRRMACRQQRVQQAAVWCPETKLSVCVWR